MHEQSNKYNSLTKHQEHQEQPTLSYHESLKVALLKNSMARKGTANESTYSTLARNL